MSLAIELHCDAPVETIVAALQEEVTEWQQAKTSSELQAHGGLRMGGSVAPPRFRLAVHSNFRRFLRDNLRLSGSVTAEGTGARVVARCGALEGIWMLPAMLAAIGAWPWYAYSELAPILPIAAIGYVLVRLGYDHLVSRDDAEVRFLTDRFYAALGRAVERSRRATT